MTGEIDLVAGANSATAMDSLGNLYKDIIVEHARHPRGKGRPPVCRYCQDGKNPLCGDAVTIFCQVENDSSGCPRLSVRFEGSGCSISQASASMMCETIHSVTVSEARSFIAKAENIYTGKTVPADPDDVDFDFEALSGVSRFPVRVKCAALAWKSLELLLNEHFDEQGRMRKNDVGCETSACAQSRRLKIVSTEPH